MDEYNRKIHLKHSCEIAQKNPKKHFKGMFCQFLKN
jgi:hypothetical protein